MIVVSDTSPILNLARIDRLVLLPSLFVKVLIPSAVYEELLASSCDLPTPIDFGADTWLAVDSPKDGNRVQQLSADLDPGEAEAIVLALEHGADLLLVDEKRGRRIAVSMGLRVTGLLGIIATAKRVGLIDEVKPILDDLIQRARFWIGPKLYAEVLTEVGEAP